MNLIKFGQRLENEIIKEDTEASESGLILAPKEISKKLLVKRASWPTSFFQ